MVASILKSNDADYKQHQTSQSTSEEKIPVHFKSQCEKKNYGTEFDRGLAISLAHQYIGQVSCDKQYRKPNGQYDGDTDVIVELPKVVIAVECKRWDRSQWSIMPSTYETQIGNRYGTYRHYNGKAKRQINGFIGYGVKRTLSLIQNLRKDGIKYLFIPASCSLEEAIGLAHKFIEKLLYGYYIAGHSRGYSSISSSRWSSFTSRADFNTINSLRNASKWLRIADNSIWLRMTRLTKGELRLGCSFLHQKLIGCIASQTPRRSLSIFTSNVISLMLALIGKRGDILPQNTHKSIISSEILKMPALSSLNSNNTNAVLHSQSLYSIQNDMLSYLAKRGNMKPLFSHNLRLTTTPMELINMKNNTNNKQCSTGVIG